MNDNFKALYAYGNYIDEVLYGMSMTPYGSYYYIHDHLYSPAALVDTSTGAAKERYEYDVYGKVHVFGGRLYSRCGQPKRLHAITRFEAW